jgi:Ca-activated chloride channel family protein
LWLILLSAVLGSCGRPAPTATSISIIYGSDKAAWLEPLIHEYNQAQSRIRVQGYTTGSLASIAAIREQTNTPTVWSPASSIYIPLAEEDWRREYGVDLITSTPNSLVLSPVVIAMWREMAETLGWPDKTIGWTDIARLAISEQGWAAYGRAEWGRFKLGHTRPDYSNSGLITLLALVYAATGKQADLTATDFAEPELRLFMENFLARVSHYGNSTGFFAEKMFHCTEGGPTYLSAAILYENLVVAQEHKRQAGTECEARHQPVVAIYPVEGTFWTDHPYIILNAPWVTPEQIAAAREFEAFLLAEPQQKRALALGFRPADPKIPYTTPLDAAHGVDSTEPKITLQPPSITIIRELLKLWAAG